MKSHEVLRQLNASLDEISKKDLEKSLDGDWGARFRRDVAMPYVKLLGEHLARTRGEDMDHWEKATEPFLESLIMTMTMMATLYAELEFKGHSRESADIAKGLCETAGVKAEQFIKDKNGKKN